MTRYTVVLSTQLMSCIKFSTTVAQVHGGRASFFLCYYCCRLLLGGYVDGNIPPGTIYYSMYSIPAIIKCDIS